VTIKAKTILQRMNKQKALKHWREFSNPERRERILNEFNRETMDDVGPVGGKEQALKILQEMNELDEAQDQRIRERFSKINVL
jgi:hypothetical protein